MPSEPVAEAPGHPAACRRAGASRSAGLPVCGDAGLRMFHEHLGRWFAPGPGPALPARTACPLCGARDVPLHAATAGAKCVAGLAISAKRAGRRSAAEPAAPAPAGSRGMVSFGAGSLAIAGPRVARAITRLLPLRPLPAHVELRYPEPGLIRQTLAGLLRDPPPPPFTVILFGQKAGFRARVTTDASLIHLNGPEPATLVRAELLELVTLFEGWTPDAVSRAAALRARLACGAPADGDPGALAALPPAVRAGLRRLPSPGSPTLTALRRLLAP